MLQKWVKNREQRSLQQRPQAVGRSSAIARPMPIYYDGDCLKHFHVYMRMNIHHTWVQGHNDPANRDLTSGACGLACSYPHLSAEPSEEIDRSICNLNTFEAFRSPLSILACQVCVPRAQNSSCTPRFVCPNVTTGSRKSVLLVNARIGDMI